MSEALKPCPFVWCARPGKLHDCLISAMGAATEFAAGCDDCNVYTPQCATAEEAIDLWNTRPPTAPEDELRAALEPFARALEAMDHRKVDDAYPLLGTLAAERLNIGHLRRARAALAPTWEDMREQCAKICEEVGDQYMSFACHNAAAAIRALSPPHQPKGDENE